jgi:glycosyltransferase involved in cell wall biosynthesis
MVKKILIAVPTFENIDPECFKAIYGFQWPDDSVLVFNYFRGYDCARARNIIAKTALDQGFDYVLMIDSDNVVPRDGLARMLAADRDIVAAWCPLKGNPNNANLYKKTDQTQSYLLENTFDVNDMPAAELIEINGAGMACVLIKTDVFRVLGENNWFRYVSYDDGESLSEDLYFCSLARSAGYKIFAHTGVRCGHIVKTIL